MSKAKPRQEKFSAEAEIELELPKGGIEQPYANESRMPVRQAPVSGLNMKGSRMRMHHLFKALVEKCTRNLSYKHGYPQPSYLDHCHFYHNITSAGRSMAYTNMTAGHYHEVTWEMKDVEEVGEDGQVGIVKKPVGKCGPAISDIPRKAGEPLTRARKRGPVQWIDKTSGDNSGVAGMLVDDHTHEMEYLWSENINIDAHKKKRVGG